RWQRLDTILRLRPRRPKLARHLPQSSGAMTVSLSLPRVIGHRGAALHAPENSLAGFDTAAELGARWVEFDVMLSADGVPVVHHDHTLERTAGRPDAVA